jgi:hypothetical protein
LTTANKRWKRSRLQRYKNPGEMQRVMEVYDLRADKAEQMNERRAMRLPEAANEKLTGLAPGKDEQ